MIPEIAFNKYRLVLEGLKATTLDSLDDVVSPDVHFADPLNEAEDLPKMKAIFAQLFETVTDVHYVIDDVGYSENGAYFRWILSASLSNKPWVVKGVTHVTFDQHSRVIAHVEYWDAASQLYVRFPIIGLLLRYARRRLAVH